LYDSLRDRKNEIVDDGMYRKYAVAVPLIETQEGTEVLFEKRASKLRRQPGEICFPGGRREPGETALENAVRETKEELLLSDDQIDVIAPMDTLLTHYDNRVDAFLIELKNYGKTFGKDEVEEIFTVPLQYFLDNDPQSHVLEISGEPGEDFPFDDIPDGRNYFWRKTQRNEYFYYYEDRVIWGMTAHIMFHTSKILRSAQK